MNKRKRAMRKFKKRSIVAPIVGFVIGIILMVVMSCLVFDATVSDVVQKKAASAKEICDLRIANVFEGAADYDNDIKRALDESGLEIIALKNGKEVYNNTQYKLEGENYENLFTGMDIEESIICTQEDLMNWFEAADITLEADDDGPELTASDLADLFQSTLENSSDFTAPIRYNVWVMTDKTYDGGSIYIHNPIAVTLDDVKLSALIVFIFVVVFIVVSIILFSNIISSVRSNNRMLKALYFDDKTLSDNWLYFTTKAEKILHKKNFRYAVVAVKCCSFEHCKSCSGAEMADGIVRRALTEIKKTLKKNELAARYSDSYIGVLVKGLNEEELRSAIENISQVVKEEVYTGAYLIDPENKTLNSLGYDDGIEDFFHYAKLACDSVNDSNEVPLAYFDDKLKEENIWIHNVETKMDEALANEEFAIYIQPKYDPKDSSLKGAEALVRWVSPEYGLVPPGRFIPIFEENGSIVKIDDYMVEHIAKLQSEWIKMGYKVVPVSVNVSRIHFMNPDLAEHICSLVDKYETPHDTIEIELTESAFFDDKKALLGTVTKLQEYGFHVSMDDFGSGYSSLNSLKDLSLDVLKLDADFFRGEDESRGELIVSKAIELAKSLNMEIVAEGVELKNQVEFLADAGCDMIQGFYYDKPMPASEYETRMSK